MGDHHSISLPLLAPLFWLEAFLCNLNQSPIIVILTRLSQIFSTVADKTLAYAVHVRRRSHVPILRVLRSHENHEKWGRSRYIGSHRVAALPWPKLEEVVLAKGSSYRTRDFLRMSQLACLALVRNMRPSLTALSNFFC